MIKSILENGSKATALLSFSVLMLTVFHDWGYFSIVGIKFLFLQTPYDYLANSITWLPFSLVLVGLYFLIIVIVMESVSKRLGASDEQVASIPHKVRLARFRKTLHRIAALCAFSTLFLLVLSYFFVWPLSILIVSTAVAPGYLIVATLMLAREAKPDGSPVVRRIIATWLLLPMMLLISFMIGATETLISTSSYEHTYFLREKEGQTKPTLILRSLDKGVLTYDAGNGKVTFTRWDALAGMERTFYRRKADGSFCDFTIHICSHPESP